MFRADCMKLMPEYPDNYFDIAIVDPPYGAGGQIKKNHCRFGGRFKKYRLNRSGGGRMKKYGDIIDKWDIAPEPEYFLELFRVSKSQIIWGGNYFGLPPNRNFIVWRKNIPENFSMSMAEYAWTNITGNAKVFEHHSQDSRRFHPTQKPVALYKWLLSKYAKQGDRILDTHFGSGSIAVACNELGFELVASEKDEFYFEKACERIRLAAAQETFDFGAKETQQDLF